MSTVFIPRGPVRRIASLASCAAGAILALGAAFGTLALGALSPATAANGVVIHQGGGARSETIMLPLNKAAIVQLPVDARDVLVANPDIVDAVVRTSRQVYILGVKVGATNAFFFDANGNQILNLEINVERDLSALRDFIAARMPDANIEVTALNDNIVLSGTVKNAIQARNARDIAAKFAGDDAKVVNTIGISGQEQVMLKVRIAEIQRTILKQLGIDWNLSLDVGDIGTAFGLLNGFGVNGAVVGGLQQLQPSQNFINGATGVGQATNVSAAGTFGGGRFAGAAGVDTGLKALEQHGLLRTLAEPNLTALSGESAKFLAGGEFPIVASRQDNEISVEFKEFGVGLAFTPVVLDAGRISLKVSTEVSELSNEGAVRFGNISFPSLTVRRAETTVELPSGGSLVMAGLLQQDLRRTLDSVPGLKDVPVLSPLFRSNDFLNQESELVIMATPYLVEPTHEANLRLPTDGFAPASDYDAYVMGRLHAVYGAEGSQAPAGLPKGPIGFIME